MRKAVVPLLIILGCLSLSGCLLDYFFAPKIAAGELPSDPQSESLRSSYISHCGRCHLLINPIYFDRSRPIDRFVERYVASKLLTRQEADEAAAYIRFLKQPIATVSPNP